MNTNRFYMDTEVDYDALLNMYRKYCDRVRAAGRVPVTFPDFMAGRYRESACRQDAASVIGP